MRPTTERTTNLASLLEQTARRMPNAPALIHGDVVTSFGEMQRRVESVCAALAARGVRKGDPIIVQARNSRAMFETMFVAFRLGAAWTPVNFRLTADDVAGIAERCGATVLFYDPVFPDHREAVLARARIKTCIALADNSFGDDVWDALADSGHSFPPCKVERDDACWYFHTSGTTGHPKAGVLTHGQMGFVTNNMLADLMPGLGIGQNDASLVVAPLSHGAGVHVLPQIVRGVTTVLTEGARFDAEEIWRLVEAHRITNMFTVPTILKTLVEHEAVDQYDHSSLRHVIYAGSPTYRVDQQRALEKLGPCIVQYYGMGEVTGNITYFAAPEHDIDDAVQQRLQTCGTARSGMIVEIQDETGAEVPPGTEGEICVMGPAVFVGYLNNQKANAEAFRDGWFRTGDLGTMDEAGYVTITGRSSDMYISGGSNIYPREIEEKLLQHPAVRECAVVGLPDPKWGEVGAVAVVPFDATAFDVDEFAAWMGEHVARYKLPRRVEVFEEMPKSGYGKVTKKLVRAAIEARDSDGS